MFLHECHMREIEEGWRKAGRAGAVTGIHHALAANVTHEGLGGERCTIQELDGSAMLALGLHVGVFVGEAKDAYDLIERLKEVKLYAAPGLSLRAQQYLGDPTLKSFILSPA